MNNGPSGILIVDKEKDMTSHDVVHLVRKRFGIKKVGHAGTLDPNATGVLVVLLGKATKLSGTFLNQDKEYEGVMVLGETTDSGDVDGRLTGTREVNVSPDDIERVAEKFQGEIYQKPPMYSAKRINGKRLYKLARKGVKVERKPHKVEVKSLKITGVDLPRVTFRVLCGKGTYVRQLAEDIGEELGCGAHLAELRRTGSGDFSVKQAVPVAELKKMEKEALEKHIITP